MADEPNPLPDEQPKPPENAEFSELESAEHRQRRRIKIKKRIKQRVRVKKKPSVKKRLKKLLGYLVWFIVIGGFLVTVLVLVKELDIKDENAKKQAPKKKQVDRTLNKRMNDLFVNFQGAKKVIHFKQTENNTALNSLTEIQRFSNYING